MVFVAGGIRITKKSHRCGVCPPSLSSVCLFVVLRVDVWSWFWDGGVFGEAFEY